MRKVQRTITATTQALRTTGLSTLAWPLLQVFWHCSSSLVRFACVEIGISDLLVLGCLDKEAPTPNLAMLVHRETTTSLQQVLLRTLTTTNAMITTGSGDKPCMILLRPVLLHTLCLPVTRPHKLILVILTLSRARRSQIACALPYTFILSY